MRRLEVRRHSYTKKDGARGRGSHLSHDGVAAARACGATLGPVGYVLTSPSPRALETAVAMGFAVDDTAEMPSGYVPGEVDHHDQWRWERPFVTYAGLIARGRGLAAAALANRALWLAALEQVPDGGTALVVGHGGTLEPALVACTPDADHAAWGPAFGHLHGATLEFDGTRLVRVAVRRGLPA
ncbi:histidine phosphatase family protein [Catellatospora sichuanensis]|uniref:histidine phosphatase family protein n=1 Tax=Catellatospora sichuanensis TaxID=1969805 RepID=UPI001182FD69|nr:histidine phosphatase family protein [Catellatospora sichuanensis]